MTKEQLIEKLNNPSRWLRLNALKNLKNLEKNDKTLIPSTNNDNTNNHIHSFYSFSPYSPTKATYMAYKNGLNMVGLVDHDSLSGYREFSRACKILNIGMLCGFESRVAFEFSQEVKENSILFGKKSGYFVIYGISKKYTRKANKFLDKYRILRNERNRQFTADLSKNFENSITIDYEEDILPLSKNKTGGSVTERHIILAIIQKLIEKYGKGDTLIEHLSSCGFDFDQKNKELLLDKNDPYYEFDLLSAIKMNAKNNVNVDFSKLPRFNELISFSKEIGGVIAYIYDEPSDVSENYLEILFKELYESGVNAISYVPSKISEMQNQIVKNLCNHYEMLELYGEKINSPRQKFKIDEMLLEENLYFIENNWALVGHEDMVSINLEDGMFSKKTVTRLPKLKDRIALYSEIAKNKYGKE